MATPTYAQVISQINTFIITNHNNEITANVLNPILVLLTDFTNNTIGDLNTLTTDQKQTVVAAINSLKNNINNISNNSVQLYTGIGDPNVTPPPTYKAADFYLQIDVNSLPIDLWQFDGFDWINSTSASSFWGGITGNIEDQTDLIDLIDTKDTETLNAAKTYTDSVITDELEFVEYTTNKQNNLNVDGTGVKYPTVDTVNLITNNIVRATLATGFLDTTDSFTLFRVDDNTLGVNASQYGIAFSQYFKTPPYAPSNGIFQITARNIPLSAIGLSGTGTAIKFVGYRASDNSIVFSDTQLIQSPSVCQLGIVLVKYSGGVTSFIDAARTTVTIPDVAAYNNLETVATGVKADIRIDPVVGTLSHSNSVGSLIGISVAWGTSNNDLLPIAASNPTSFTRLHPGNKLTVAPPATFTTLDPLNYWNGTALVAVPAANNASVQRLLLTVRGNFVWQYGEQFYSNLALAQNNMSHANFTNILPIGTFAEVGRMAIQKNCTDIASASAQYVPTGANGGGGSSPVAPATWGAITGNIDDQLDLKAKLDAKGTVNSVSSLILSSNGAVLQSSVANPNTNPIISLNVPLVSNAGATQGMITKTEYDTFNAKQNAITNPVTGIGASGQVTFWNSPNTQSGDDSLFWDNGNKRLIIGAKTGLQKLSVFGDSTNPTIGLNCVVGSGNANARNWGFQTNFTTYGDFGIMQGSVQDANPMSGITRFYIGPTGNVGIENTNPTAKIHINYNGNTQSAIILNSIAAGSGSGAIQWHDNGTSKWNLATDPSNNMFLYNQDGGAAGYNLFIEKTTGRFGFGTNTPKPFGLVTVNGSLTTLGSVYIDARQSYRMNNYFDVGAVQDKAISNGYSGDVYLDVDGGIMNFRIAPSTTAGSNAALATKMSINNSGNLTVVGTVTASSDIRLKTNIKPLENSLYKVLKTQGVKFDRTDTGDKNQIGMLAQQLEEIFPELVATSTEPYEGGEGLKSVNYGAMTAVLIEAIKELKAEINDLKFQLNLN